MFIESKVRRIRNLWKKIIILTKARSWKSQMRRNKRSPQERAIWTIVRSIASQEDSTVLMGYITDSVIIRNHEQTLGLIVENERVRLIKPGNVYDVHIGSQFQSVIMSYLMRIINYRRKKLEMEMLEGADTDLLAIADSVVKKTPVDSDVLQMSHLVKSAVK